MEINQDVRALSNSSYDLPEAVRTYLMTSVEGMETEVADDDNGDVDAELCAALAIKDALGESSRRSQHLNGNSRSVARTERSLNQCGSRLGLDTFVYSVFRSTHSSSVLLTST